MSDIDHVVVLALENRSFDHMLGYLDHSSPRFDGLTAEGHFNLDWDGTAKVETSPRAKWVLPVDPDHSHDAVMEQLALDENGRPRMEGFVASYERKGRGLAMPTFGGVLAPLIRWNQERKAKKNKVVAGRGPLIMLSQPPTSVPVLSTLAKEFAICTRWFCSVPGETWPNRNFMHAATSDGETNINPRFYKNRTIFEQLEDAGRDWRIYFDDTPQIWAFERLWNSDERRAKWFHSTRFFEHVEAGDLPAYSFIEPNHRPPFHLVDEDPIVERGDGSDSQHPGNNLVHNDVYDDFHTDEPVDFARGEALIARVYEALRANPDLFAKTLLLITYDEHGGFYDHVAPPQDVPDPGRRPSPLTALTRWIWHRNAKHFDFKMLGLRVPTVVVSPLVSPGTVSSQVYDHSSIPATVRKLFAPGMPPLTARDAWAAPFDAVCDLDSPRSELPDLSHYCEAVALPDNAEVESAISEQGDVTHMPDYFCDLVDLSDRVRRRMERKGIADTQVNRAAPARLRAHRSTTAFGRAARDARAKQGK